MAGQRTSTPIKRPDTPMPEPFTYRERETINQEHHFLFNNSVEWASCTPEPPNYFDIIFDDDSLLRPPPAKKPRIGRSPLKQPSPPAKMYVGNMTERAKFGSLITPEKDVARGESEKQADLIDWENDVSENVYGQQQGDKGHVRRISAIKQDAAKAEAARQLRDKMDGIDSLPWQQRQNQQEDDADRTWILCPDCADFVSPDHCHFYQGAGYIDSIANPLLATADETTEALLDTIVNSVLN